MSIVCGNLSSRPPVLPERRYLYPPLCDSFQKKISRQMRLVETVPAVSYFPSGKKKQKQIPIKYMLFLPGSMRVTPCNVGVIPLLS